MHSNARPTEEIKTGTVLVVDPMLATGGSASAAITAVKKRGAVDIRFVGLVGCPEGVAMLQGNKITDFKNHKKDDMI